MHIRPETPADIDAITTLTAAAFLAEAHSSHTEQYIVLALRAAGQLTLSLVADGDAGIVGHVALSPVTIDGGSTGWYGLGPLSVSPARQRQGIGSALVQQALTALRQQGAQGCVLLGDPAYYGRFGFAHLPALQLAGLPADYARYFQALPFGPEQPAGVVRYHDAFNAQD